MKFALVFARGAIAGALLSSAAQAQSAPPYVIKTGGGTGIVSQMQPAIEVHVDSTLKLIGSQRFVLYGVAQAEQHLFAQTDGNRIVRFLWVQYEEYLPSSNGQYDYSSSALVSHSGREFRADKNINKGPPTQARPESDGARMRALVGEKGLSIAPATLYERLVWVPDTTRRRELMVIYMEDIALQNLKLADIEGSPAADKRLADALAQHQTRAFAAFTVRPVK